MTGKYYRHFKGNVYRVLHIAKHSETLEDIVVYQAVYGERGYRIPFCNILTLFHMCLIPPIIHFYNEILR